MTKKRVTRKQLLKEPDEFITTTGILIAWAKKNTRNLMIGGGIFFGVIIFISIYGYIRQARTNNAQMMFSQVVSKYQAEAEQKNDIDALKVVKADFDALIESHGNMPAGQIGRIFYGHISLAGKAYDQAILHYQTALNDFGHNSALTNIILNGLGTAYLQKGEYLQSVERFRKLADSSSMVLKDTALFNLGRLYEQLKKPEESKKAYEQLHTKFPNSMYADIAREKIAGS